MIGFFIVLFSTLLFMSLVIIGSIKNWDDDSIALCIVFMAIGIFILIMIIIFIPIERHSDRILIKEMALMQKTINEARTTASKYELAALTQKIVEVNRELAKLKIKREYVIHRWHIAKEIETAPFIK